MKKFILDFIHRGLLVAFCGPLVLAIIYGILGAAGVVESLAPADVAKGIFSITVMAFIAAGITAIYTVERLPLISAILIHAGVLYLDYLVLYLLNNWIRRDIVAISVFTGIFAAGYALIWLGIYFFTRTNTRKLNRKLPK